jgi:signal transduction histidine kinase
VRKFPSTPVQAFLGIVVILSAGIYGLSDYYLNSIGTEMMLDWTKSEAVSVQEGNLLTSVTKSQPYLASSNYVKGVELLKASDGQFSSRIALGARFEPKLHDAGIPTNRPVIKRIGFLHSQVAYRIPSNPEFVLVFDLESPILNFVFFGSIAVLILLLLGLISLLSVVESNESQKRERLLKLAISDLVFKDSATDLLDVQFPEIAEWWKTKKKELADIDRVASENDRKILLGEMASCLAHDIKNPLRNIRTLVKRTNGLDESQTTNLFHSINKIEAIASTISERTKDISLIEVNRRSIVDIQALVERAAAEKSSAGQCLRINFSPNDRIECYLNSLEFERALSNLIDNAIDATRSNGSVKIGIKPLRSAVEISIVDSGSGIAAENLPKIGVKGYTGANGTGLGVFYAKKFIDESGGSFSIRSNAGEGTTVQMILPTVRQPEVPPRSIQLRRGTSLAILDDDPLVLKAAMGKMKPHMLEANEIEFKLFQKASALEAWLHTVNSELLVVTDFHLDGETENGLDLIERLGLGAKSLVFTSAPEDEKLMTKARHLGVPVLGKDAFFAMPLIII